MAFERQKKTSPNSPERTPIALGKKSWRTCASRGERWLFKLERALKKLSIPER